MQFKVDGDNLHGRRVLITAGAQGLGWEMAKQFLVNGSQVLISDINESALQAAKASYPDVHTICSDVANEQDVAAMFAAVEKVLGGLDVLINNAGVAGPTAYTEDINKADWDHTLAVNITGQFLCVQRAIPLLKASESGVIINLSSAAGHLGFAGRAPYSASKWAVVGFTKTLAIELGRFGIPVNAILPGAVDGDRIRAVIEAKAKTLNKPVQEVTQIYENQASLGRMIQPDDVVNMALFLASNAGRSISGQALVVDGHTQALS